ncbi:MAG: helix-turn-helix transcriptional regulator [Clostridiales bacterium]|nr:helix-turn-helix transcriptional regulator [Candidatus Crickella merdequi]
MDIGERIKELRIERGLTQEELADRAELSKGFISQIERNLTSPSIATLEDVVLALGMDFKTFFSDDEEKQVVFTDDDYYVKEDCASKYTIEWIVPNAQKNEMEPVRLTLEAGGSTMVDNPHEGEEFGYVMSGTIVIHIGSEEYKAKEGDTFYIYPEKPHYISSDKGAQIIWVSSPPSF